MIKLIFIRIFLNRLKTNSQLESEKIKINLNN